MTLSGEEFARRFLQHVLPSGFVRIRHYGLLANRGRREKLRQCRLLLVGHETRQQVQATRLPVEVLDLCARCGEGEMRLVERLPAQASRADAERCPVDTS